MQNWEVQLPNWEFIFRAQIQKPPYEIGRVGITAMTEPSNLLIHKPSRTRLKQNGETLGSSYLVNVNLCNGNNTEHVLDPVRTRSQADPHEQHKAIVCSSNYTRTLPTI